MSSYDYWGGYAKSDDNASTWCYKHDFVDTGLLVSWCKKCNTDGVYNRLKQCYVAKGHENDPFKDAEEGQP